MKESIVPVQENEDFRKIEDEISVVLENLHLWNTKIVFGQKFKTKHRKKIVVFLYLNKNKKNAVGPGKEKEIKSKERRWKMEGI